MSSLHHRGDLVHNRYQIYALIGQGGTGETYQAEDLQHHRWVALKVMSLKQLGRWDLLDRFEREAAILESMDHPSIPSYVEHFCVETESDCRFYLAQEFAAGKSLDRWVQEGWRATETEVQRIALAVLEILVYLHGQTPAIVHRDIKPQNIIRQPDGHIFLVDFGAVQSAHQDCLRQQGTFIGTLGYMPPEQLRGQAKPASDLYALGATLVFLLTHRHPDELPMERMSIHFQGRVQLSLGLTDWLEHILEPNLRERFRSAQAAHTALSQLLMLPSPPQRLIGEQGLLPSRSRVISKVTPQATPKNSREQRPPYVQPMPEPIPYDVDASVLDDTRMTPAGHSALALFSALALTGTLMLTATVTIAIIFVPFLYPWLSHVGGPLLVLLVICIAIFIAAIAPFISVALLYAWLMHLLESSSIQSQSLRL